MPYTALRTKARKAKELKGSGRMLNCSVCVCVCVCVCVFWCVPVCCPGNQPEEESQWSVQLRRVSESDPSLERMCYRKAGHTWPSKHHQLSRYAISLFQHLHIHSFTCTGILILGESHNCGYQFEGWELGYLIWYVRTSHSSCTYVMEPFSVLRKVQHSSQHKKGGLHLTFEENVGVGTEHVSFPSVELLKTKSQSHFTFEEKAGLGTEHVM